MLSHRNITDFLPRSKSSVCIFDKNIIFTKKEEKLLSFPSKEIIKSNYDYLTTNF